MNRYLFFFVIAVTFSSCDLNNDCGDCFTPPRSFGFDFIDKDTSENLFTNHTFNDNNLSVIDEKGKEINFKLIYINDRHILSLNEIGWELAPKIYTIKLSDEVSVIVSLDMDKMEGDCCTYFEVKEFGIQDFEYTSTSLTGIIQVKI
ncbi:MAG: hypothetical protein ACOH1N_05245 [Lutibacter sp.]